MMDREDIATIGERLLNYYIANPPAKASSRILRVTSGTSSGTPILIMRGYKPIASEKFDTLMKPVMCFASRNAQLWLVLSARHSSNNLQRIFLLDITKLIPKLGALLNDFLPDSIDGIANFVVRMAPYVSGLPRTSVKYLYMGGERLTEMKIILLKKLFPEARLISEYAAAEIGMIGRATCEYLPPNFYHPAKDAKIEIIEKDKDGIGPLLISRDIGGAMVEQYQIGDFGRIHPACPCGEPVTFEVAGRSGVDYIKLVGGIVRREELDRVTGLYRNYIEDWQAEVKEEVVDGVVRGHITLHIHRTGGAVTEGLRHEIREGISKQLFLTPTKTLSDLVIAGVFSPLTIIFTSTPFPPPKNKDIKIRLAS